ncbi:MAG: DEAD/DEAH box helicase [Spirochaetaceae bacterium]|nr:DEAD/DEAH box helicase [Spirochaetaceae bacterium]
MQNFLPLIVQSDKTLLLDVHAPEADACRTALIPFAELEKSPEHLHTYKITPLSLWNATSAHFSPEDIISVLHKFSRYPVPLSVEQWIAETASRFGKIQLIAYPKELLQERFGTELKEDYLLLVTETDKIFKELNAYKVCKKYLVPDFLPDETSPTGKQVFRLLLTDRGTIKQELLQLGWPVQDNVPLKDGEPLAVSLRTEMKKGGTLQVRDYQRNACNALLGDMGPGTGFGTIVLPCGAGKTMVGMTIMDSLKTDTLVLTTNISAVHQWKEELLDKTNLTEDQIGEYTGESKVIKPVTIATYQVLTWRPEKEGPYPHFQLFREHPWGLIIYDEVHMLPAPVFRVTAEIQAIRRVGLTATLVREDGCEGHVFSLVGPKRYDVPWKELESCGWIADAECVEIRLDMAQEKELDYVTADLRKKHRIASENPSKFAITQKIVNLYPYDKILIIGQYLEQLYEIAKMLKAPIITGKTPNGERDLIYKQFRSGEIRVLVVSKVANFAIDLPDASVAIQVSGTFGSRQEEAQRLGRILRPKERKSRFFTLITRNTVEEEFGANRQKFLAEQGYSYRLLRNPDELEEVL